MTREEAIEQLEYCIELIKCNGKDWLDERDIPMLNIAIKALRREIPKNPVINFVSDSDGSRRLDEGWTEDALLCPVCHSYVGEVFDELYCRKCGQKIVQKRVRVIV